ncbi:hypothetical protein DXZ20_17925 [Leptolyngbyaceae cyanobacterium CCMR0081]|uniref:Uncharacterized protein n=2 Tax=Adonisia TaxID=2950183 RepID=A0A6M0RML9_9CYAN|nr:hypothetical protein [Adonisia turfae CCMR0081]
MDSTVVAAIIGGVFTVAGSIATVLITRHIENQDKQIMSTGRRALLNGQWRGTGTSYREGGQLLSVSVVATLVAHRKTVIGHFRVQYPERDGRPAQESEFESRGGMLHDRFLKLDYISKNERRIQFGAIMLELAPSGEVLSGKFVGYGVFSKQIVSGNIELKRAA